MGRCFHTRRILSRFFGYLVWRIDGTCSPHQRLRHKDGGSNFIGARNDDLKQEQKVPENVLKDMHNYWRMQGKTWDINPPLASHFGGVWERAIGQIRQIIQGYLITDNRLLSKEEFHTMLLYAAKIVNSTPLHDASESPNESQPITPHHLITQRDDSCREKYSRPANYTQDDLLAYGANRWKRVEALADEFARYWKDYLYQIGTNREKWYSPQRNAQVGDTVLLKDKNNHRLLWSTGTITSVTTDKDGLVRRVMVQPHKRHEQSNTPQARERAIHDLVLLKAINAKDNPVPDCTTSSSTPPEAKILLRSTTSYDREMFCNNPSERPKATYTNTSTPCSLQTPKQLIEQPKITEEEIATIQDTASAFLNKITKLRQQPKLNPEAVPFNPSVFHTKIKPQKKLRWKINLTQIYTIEHQADI